MIYLPTLHTFAMNNVFTGSAGLLRFKLTPQVVKQEGGREVDMAKSKIRAELWHGLYCYEKSEIEADENLSEDERTKKIAEVEEQQEKLEQAGNDALTKLRQTIYNEIFRICTTLFQKPDCCALGSDGEIKIVFFAKDEIDEQLLQFHIAGILSDIVGTSASKSIVLLTAGICPNAKGTMAFLQQG